MVSDKKNDKLFDNELPIPKQVWKNCLYRFFDIISAKFLNDYMFQPLKFFGVLGLILLFGGFIILGYFGFQWIITRELHVRPLLLLGGGVIIMGIQFFSIGFLGELIAHSGWDKDGNKEN